MRRPEPAAPARANVVPRWRVGLVLWGGMPMDLFRPCRLPVALSVVVVLLGFSKPAATWAVQVEPPPSPELLARLVMEWDLATGKQVRMLRTPDQAPVARLLALSKNGKALVSCAYAEALVW